MVLFVSVAVLPELLTSPRNCGVVVFLSWLFLSQFWLGTNTNVYVLRDNVQVYTVSNSSRLVLPCVVAPSESLNIQLSLQQYWWWQQLQW